MIFKAKVTKPESVDVTISITMTLGEWMYLRRNLSSNSVPSAKFKNEINDLIRQIENEYYGTTLPATGENA